MKHPMLEGRPLLIGDRVRIKDDGRIGRIRSIYGSAGRALVCYSKTEGLPVKCGDLCRVPRDWTDEHAEAITDARAWVAGRLGARSDPRVDVVAALKFALVAAADAWENRE